MSCEIRKYRPEDKEALRHICLETAGDYFRRNEKTFNAVPIIYSDYFTENEPENIFVIDDGNGTAVGYILCSTDCDGFRKKMLAKYIPRAVKAGAGMLPACIGYSFAHLVNGRKNAVHLHIDILPDYQHMGLGTKLIDTLRKHLYNKGIDRLSVNTIDRNEPPYKFYTKYGFKENRHYIGSLYSLTISTCMKAEAKK